MTETLSATMAERLWQFYAGAPVTTDDDDLAALAGRFIDLKRYLGYRYASEEGHLRRFLAFMQARGVRGICDLSVDAMLAWAGSRPGAALQREVSAVSVFMDHLKAIGKIVNNLCWFMKRRPRPNYRPYIFTADELRRIFARRDEADAAGERAFIYRVIYACGLRASEVVHLKLRGFDAEDGTIFIEKTKFNKDRRLPLHPRVLGEMRRFRDERRGGAASGEPFFVNAAAGGRAYTRRELTKRFQQDLAHHGIYRPTCRTDGITCGSPRLHALRHSFAVHRLLRWYREGADVQAKLPLLSTYLGHSDVLHTQVYLKVTGLLLREASHRFAGRCEREFPLSP